MREYARYRQVKSLLVDLRGVEPRSEMEPLVRLRAFGAALLQDSNLRFGGMAALQRGTFASPKYVAYV